MITNRYIEINEPFNTEYSTWIIAFCPDTDSFFVTNQRHFFYVFEEEFDTEEAAIDYFENCFEYFIEVENIMMRNMIYGWDSNKVFLENTNKWYCK